MIFCQDIGTDETHPSAFHTDAKKWTKVARVGWTEEAMDFFDRATKRERKDREEYNKRNIAKEDRIDKFLFDKVVKDASKDDSFNKETYIPDDDLLYEV